MLKARWSKGGRIFCELDEKEARHLYDPLS